jgi:hypothetical protein
VPAPTRCTARIRRDPAGVHVDRLVFRVGITITPLENQRLHVHVLVVDVQRGVERNRLGAEVADHGEYLEHGRSLIVATGVHREDRDIVPPLADADHLHVFGGQPLDGQVAGIGDIAVGENGDAGRRGGRFVRRIVARHVARDDHILHERLGQGDRFGQGGGAFSRFDRVDSPLEQLLVRLERTDHRRPIAEADDHCPRTVRQIVDLLFGLFLSQRQPRLALRFFHAHRCRLIHQQNQRVLLRLLRIPHRLAQGESGQQQYEQLQPQQQIVADVLEGGVDLEILDGALPQQRRRNRQGLPPQLEKIQRHQRRNGKPRSQRNRTPTGKKVHG